MITISDYTRNGSFSVNYLVDPMYITKECNSEIIVGRNAMFGTMLFVDNEIQISTLDYDKYHDKMMQLANPKDDEDILVIGDGDGGFTQYASRGSQIEYVEQSKKIMKIGETYFGALWNYVKKVNVMPIQDFVPTKKYDVILLAITDDFNRTPLVNWIKTFISWLNPGGRLVSQVGCLLDYTYDEIKSIYDGLDMFSKKEYDTDYYLSFLSHHTFFKGVL